MTVALTKYVPHDRKYYRCSTPRRPPSRSRWLTFRSRLKELIDEAEVPLRWARAFGHHSTSRDGWKISLPLILGEHALLWYDEGEGLRPHIDDLQEHYGFPHAHLRLNILLRNAEKGGVFEALDDECALELGPRVLLLRADETVHSVSIVEEGRRVVLSLAVVIPGRWARDHLLVPHGQHHDRHR